MTVWDDAFEASPDDQDDFKYGASKIRELKGAISERLELEHNFKQGGSPSHKAGECAVCYVGNSSSIANLSGVQGGIAFDTQLYAFKVYDSANGWVRREPFPAGTKMLFAQQSAPAGWTLDTTWHDRVLRVVNANGGATGGSWTISGLTVEGHALTIDEIPAHSHTLTLQSIQRDAGSYPGARVDKGETTTSEVGGGQPHSHDISHDGSWRPAYLDVIVCSKD